ncbi:MAG: hypothetical protein ACK40Q_01070 [Pseudothermotoga sp.]
MRYLLAMLVLVALLVLAGCIDLFQNPGQIAQGLVDEFVNVLKNNELPDPEDSPTEFMNLARKFIYVRDADKNDSDVIGGTEGVLFVVAMDFVLPATLTQVKVLAAQENSAKFGNLVSDKPNFVDKVYILALEGKTQDSTITSFSLPMITVGGKGYFYTVFIETTDSSTGVEFYPYSTLFLFP